MGCVGPEMVSRYVLGTVERICGRSSVGDEKALVLSMIRVQMLSNDNSVDDAPFRCVK